MELAGPTLSLSTNVSKLQDMIENPSLTGARLGPGGRGGGRAVERRLGLPL